jgi:hypothetical protein
MKTQARKVAAFRGRLANRQANWAIDTPARAEWTIDIPATKRITLQLTEEQQALLRRETKHHVPSVTLVLYSDRLEPDGQALAYLEIGRSLRQARPRRKAGKRAARS